MPAHPDSILMFLLKVFNLPYLVEIFENQGYIWNFVVRTHCYFVKAPAHLDFLLGGNLVVSLLGSESCRDWTVFTKFYLHVPNLSLFMKVGNLTGKVKHADMNEKLCRVYKCSDELCILKAYWVGRSTNN